MQTDTHHHNHDQTFPSAESTTFPGRESILAERSANRRITTVNTLSGELIDTARELCRWGAENKYPSIRHYPQYPRLREIGQALFDCGGYSAMGKALEHVDGDPELSEAFVARLIEFGWSGIAGWEA